AISHPAEFATTLVAAVEIICGAAVVLNAGRIAGFALTTAWEGAVVAGMALAPAAVSIAETVYLMFLEAVPAAAAAGTLVTAAFVAAIGASIVVPIVVYFSIKSDLDKQAADLEQKTEDFVRDASL